MHYHNVFLVRAYNKFSALKLTEAFLEPFKEQNEVDPWKDHLTDNDIERMCKHYNIDPSDKEAVLDALPKWDGDGGGYDAEGKLFYWRTYNPQGQWDWRQWGGRWMWSSLNDDYLEAMTLEKTYENGEISRIYGEGIEWDNGIITFPDGTTKKASGAIDMDYALKSWVHEHPELSEVIDATNAKFFDLIETGIRTHYERTKWWQKQEKEHEGKDDPSDMAEWYRQKLGKSGQAWQTESYFWNITENSFGYNKGHIMEEPKRWFLVNVDLHS